MLILTKISMVDLCVVCFITISLILLMIGIIVLSSKKSLKKPSKKDIKIEVKETPIKEEVKKETLEKPKDIHELVKEDPIKESKKTDIASVLEKMENELENGPSKKTISFEEEQEQKAIISYRELLKVAGKLKEEIKENEEYGEPKDTVITRLEEIKPKENVSIKLDKVEDKIKEPIVKEEKQEVKEKKFQSSEFISPIYGKQAETYSNKHAKNDENEDFLSSLKDFRKNLQ